MENKVGLDIFYTDTPGVGGRLKKYPEDFIVDERGIDLQESEGDYTIAKVWARNWETNRLIDEFSRKLEINRDAISFSGTKDKRAITTQWISFEVKPERLEELSIPDVEIKEYFTSHRSLYRGAHKGNSFEVIVRDMDEEDIEERIDEIGSQLKDIGGFPNWFGVQRFGTLRPITHTVGKCLIMNDFEEAVRTYVANPMEGEEESCYRAREFLEETWDFEEALNRYPDVLTFERKMLMHLAENPRDYIGALRRLPHNLLMMFVHAYQSYLFNRMITERLEEGLQLKDVQVGDFLLPADEDGLPVKSNLVEVEERNLEKASSMVKNGKAYVSAPLFGHKSEFSKGKQGEIEREIIESEDIEREDFIIPRISSISSTGTRREIFAPAGDLQWELKNGGLYLSFYLNKGSYATTLLREFMKLPPEKIKKYS